MVRTNLLQFLIGALKVKSILAMADLLHFMLQIHLIFVECKAPGAFSRINMVFISMFWAY